MDGFTGKGFEANLAESAAQATPCSSPRRPGLRHTQEFSTMEEATPTPSPPQPTLLYHSTLTSFPSPPSSSLASILLSKPRVLTSIRIIPPSQPAFEYHPSSTQLDEPSPSPFPTTLDLYLNAKYPPSSAPPRSADWKANSLHKISLDLPPYDPIPEAYEFPLPLVEAGAASSLLVFRGSFARLTVSVYGHPSAKSAQEIPEVDWTLYTSLWSRNSSEWETPSLLGVDTSLALLRRLAGDPPLDDGLDHQPVEDGRGGEDEGTNEIEDRLRVNKTLLEEEAAGMDVDPSFSEDDNPPTPSASAPPNKRLHILTTRTRHSPIRFRSRTLPLALLPPRGFSPTLPTAHPARPLLSHPSTHLPATLHLSFLAATTGSLSPHLRISRPPSGSRKSPSG
jgi:hypothetical protein